MLKPFKKDVAQATSKASAALLNYKQSTVAVAAAQDKLNAAIAKYGADSTQAQAAAIKVEQAQLRQANALEKSQEASERVREAKRALNATENELNTTTSKTTGVFKSFASGLKTSDSALLGAKGIVENTSEAFGLLVRSLLGVDAIWKPLGTKISGFAATAVAKLSGFAVQVGAKNPNRTQGSHQRRPTNPQRLGQQHRHNRVKHRQTNRRGNQRLDTTNPRLGKQNRLRHQKRGHHLDRTHPLIRRQDRLRHRKRRRKSRTETRACCQRSQELLRQHRHRRRSRMVQTPSRSTDRRRGNRQHARQPRLQRGQRIQEPRLPAPGSHLKSLATGAVAAVGAGITAIGATVLATGKQALAAYATWEQAVGGVDTLFKDASGTVQKYASEAYKTAGIGANDYMNQVTSFAASLVSSLAATPPRPPRWATRPSSTCRTTPTRWAPT